MRGWLLMLRAELPLLRDLPESGERPLPRVAVPLGPSVPGWALRVASAVLAGVVLLVATGRVGMDPDVAWVVTGIVFGVMAVWPSPSSAQAVVVLAGLLVAWDPYGPFDPVVLALVPLAYSLVRLSWWAQRVSLIARIEWAALARGVPRGLVFVAGTVAFGALVFLLAGQPSALVVVAGGVALVVLSGLLFLRRS